MAHFSSTSRTRQEQSPATYKVGQQQHGEELHYQRRTRTPLIKLGEAEQVEEGPRLTSPELTIELHSFVHLAGLQRGVKGEAIEVQDEQPWQNREQHLHSCIYCSALL